MGKLIHLLNIIYLTLLIILPNSALLQEIELKYPNKPITFIMPTPAGSEADTPCRLIAKEAEKFLGQPIIVVNKPGASQTIGISAIAFSKPDGYTIGQAGHPGLFFAPFMEKVPYHPVNDIKPIIQFGYLNIAIYVKGDSIFKNFNEVIAFAKKNPKKLTYGTAGTGTAAHFAMLLISKKEEVQFTHIPFKGSPETQAALLGGHIQIGTGGFSHGLVESGQIRLLLLISEVRSNAYPIVPILKEFGYDIPAPMFLNVVGPKSLPEVIVKRLENAFTQATKEATYIKGMNELHLTIHYRNSKDLENYIYSNYKIFEKLMKELGFTK